MKHNTRILTRLWVSLLLMMHLMVAQAQVRCQILRRQNPLPPSVGELYTNFGRYFAVTLSNDQDIEINVRLALVLEGPYFTGSNPNGDAGFSRESGRIFVSSRMPLPMGLKVPARQSRMLSEYELTSHFNQYTWNRADQSQSNVILEGLFNERFNDVTNITQVESQLLPEGHYNLQLNVLNNMIGNEEFVDFVDSNSSEWFCLGKTEFDIAYKAQAPQFTAIAYKTVYNIKDFTITPDMLKGAFVRFNWTRPQFNAMFASLTSNRQFIYDFKLLQLAPGQDVSQATTVRFEQNDLITNFCDIPIQEILSAQNEDNGAGYGIQVRARSAYEDINNAYFSLIANDGFSDYVHISFSDKASDSDDAEDPEQIRNDETPTASDLTVTIAPRQASLPIQLAPYFETPGALFSVVIDNTEGEERDVNLMLQYYKTDKSWGLMTRTKDQWTDLGHIIHLEANAVRILTPEEINNAAGGYTMDKVVEYYPASGFVGPITHQTEWLEAPNIASIRVGEFKEGVSATRSNKLACNTCQFGLLTTGAQAQVSVNMTRKGNAAFPTNAEAYFDNPEELLSVSLENKGLLPQDVVIQLVLINVTNNETHYYGYNPDNRYIDRVRSTRLTLMAGGTPKVLTNEELHERIGGFPGVYDSKEKELYGVEGSTLSDNYRLLLQVFDPDKASFDDTYGYFTPESGLLTQTDLYFGTQDVSMDFDFAPDVQVPPFNAEGYFKNPGDYFQLRLFNNSGKDYNVIPVLTLFGPEEKYVVGKERYILSGDEEEIISRAKDNTGGELHALKLNIGESPLLKGDALSKILGSLTKVSKYSDGYETLNLEDCMLASGKQKIRIDLYDAEALKDCNPGHMSDLDVLSTTELEIDLQDLIVKIRRRASQPSTKASSHYLMPADTYSISVINRLEDTRVVFLQLMTTDLEGKEWAIWGAYDNYDVAGQWVKAKGLEIKAEGQKETVMTPEQINEMLGGYEMVMRADLKGDGDQISEMTTVESILPTESQDKPSLLPEGKAKTIIYAYPFFSPFAEDQQEFKHIGENAIATDTVVLDLKNIDPIDVIVNVKKDVADNMPTETLPYFQNPGDLFDVSLVNRDIEDHTIGMNFVYNHKLLCTSMDRMTPERAFKLPGRGNKIVPDTVQLTKEQINALVGGYTLDQVREYNPVERTLGKCEAPNIGSGNGHLTAVAFEDKWKTDTLGVDSTEFYISLEKVIINDFELNITNSERITDPKAKGYNGYKGEGFIEYSPLGFPIKLAVEFDSIWIDDNNIVTKGMVRSKKKEESQRIIPYELFEVTASDQKKDNSPGQTTLSDSKEKIDEILQGSKIGTYYNYVQDGLTYVNDIADIAASRPVTLPLGIDTTHAIMKHCPVGIQMLSAAWTPDSSWVNLLGEYKMPETNAVAASNNVLVLAAPFLRIKHDDKVLLPESGTLALLSDVTFSDPSTGFDFTCLSPTKINTLDDLRSAQDGCLVSWTKSEFDSLLLDVSLGIPYLLSDDGKGNIIDKNGKPVTDIANAARPKARLTANIGRDGNWIGRVIMSSFQVPDAEGFTFTLTGNETGILYDHSLRSTPDGVKFHKNYNYQHENITSAEHSWSADKRNNWQGLYWEKLEVRFPDWLPAITNKDKNGTEEKQNIVVNMHDMMYDLSGFTAAFGADTLINLAMSGWGFTLDRMHLDVVQNNFGGFGFDGRITVPFMVDAKKNPGAINYTANMAYGNTELGEDVGDVKINFETKADTANFKVGFLPVIDMDFAGSYFNLNYTTFEHPEKHDNKKDDFKIKLVLNGSMGLASDESAGFNLPDIHFYNMYVANHLVQFTDKQKEVAGLKLWEGPTWHNGKMTDGSDATLALSAGNWSLASMAKKLGPFQFTLDKFEATDTKISEDIVEAKLLVKGGVNIMDGIAGVTAGIKLPFELNWKTKDAEIKKPEFDELVVGCNFAGVKLDGSLKAIETKSDEESGYDGSIKITLPGDLIYINTKGGFHKRVRKADYKFTLEDGTQLEADETYSTCYLEAEVGSNVGIPLGVVRLTEISGGFYINCMRDGSGNIVDKYGSYGGMFGMKMADASGTMVNGGFKLLVFYDSHAEKTGTTTYDAVIDGKKVSYTKQNYSGRLSEIRLLGDIHAITKSATSDGLINATAMILYKYVATSEVETETPSGNETEKPETLEHYLQISITLSGSASSGFDYSDFQKQLNDLVADSGLDVKKIASGATANIEETEALKDEDKSGAQGGKPSEKEKSSDSENHATPPSAEVNIDFKISFIKPEGGGNYPWYLRVGTPTERCKFTIIDFSFGDKAVGAGALLGANAYICLGNELPEMPPLPQKVREFIYGESSTQNNQISQTGAKAAESDEARRSSFGTMFDPSTSNGGLMIGAEVYGHFWCNALICYADVDFDAGFDIALMKLKDGYVCAESNKRPGKNDWYGQGQLYAYMKGEVGVMIKFLGEVNRYPIVSLGLGGVLQAGMPNPTWFFGKFRAKGEIFGGLIKFNRSVEVKAGNVCTPLSASPLDDIDIFADVTPGLEETERDRAWNEKNAVSTFSSILYHTNMVLDEKLELMDENLLAQNVDESGSKRKITLGTKKSYRTFRFHQDEMLLQRLSSPSADPDKESSWTKVYTQVIPVQQREYQMNATTDFGILPENSRFRIRLIGHATEYVNGKWQNPMFKSLQTKEYDTYEATDTLGIVMTTRIVKEGEDYTSIWRDTLDYYFCTGPTSKALADNILLSYPENDGDLIFENEARKPVISLRQSLMSNYENASNGQHVVVRVSKPKGWKRNLLSSRGSINEPSFSKYLAPLYEYDVYEVNYDKKDAKYILWSPVASSYKELSNLEFESTETKWYDPTLETISSQLLGSDKNAVTSYEDRVPYVLQYILVTPSQKDSERSHVETTEEYALKLVGQTDQEYVKGRSRTGTKTLGSRLPGRTVPGSTSTSGGTIMLDVPGRNASSGSSAPAASYGYDNAYNDFINQGLSPAEAEARAKELYEYTPGQGEFSLSDFAANFNEEIERELLSDRDTTENNAIDEKNKHLADQSEQVLWSRVFYPVMDDREQFVKNFAAAFQLQGKKPEFAYKQTFFNINEYKYSWGESYYMTSKEEKPLTHYYVKFTGLTGKGSEIFGNDAALTDLKLIDTYLADDPWRILGLSQLGFWDGAIYRHNFIPTDWTFSNAQAMSIDIHTSSSNVWQRDNSYVGTMPSYSTQTELASGTQVASKMQDWILAPARATVKPTLYNAETRDQMMLDDARYLWSMAAMTEKLASLWNTYEQGFKQAAGITNGYNVVNQDKARNWIKTYSTSANVVTAMEASVSGISSLDRIAVTIPLNQIPLLYARDNAMKGFYGSDNVTYNWWTVNNPVDMGWLLPTSSSVWTQRMFNEGIFYYFKDKHILFNQYYSQWFHNKWNLAMNTVLTTKNWRAHWLDSQTMNYTLYRPNIAIWDKKLGTTVYIVMDLDENTTKTNTFGYSIPAGYFWNESGKFYYTGNSQKAQYTKIYGRYE